MNIKELIFSFFLLLSFFTLVKAQTSSADVFKVETELKGKIYQNNLYNFSFEMPKDWTEISSDDSKEYAKSGKDLLKPNKKGQQQFADSIDLTKILLTISKHRVGTVGNASLSCAVEASEPPEATIAQISLASQESFKNNFGYTIISDSKNVTLGNENFYLFKMKKTIEPNVTLYQSVYLKKIGTQILHFVLAYLTPEDEAIMEKSLQTIKFTKKK